MLTIRATNRFLKDVKLARKRGKEIDKLEHIVNMLQSEQPLLRKNRDHALSGNWKSHRECHIEPDWLLIYQTQTGVLILERTGSHSDLFG